MKAEIHPEAQMTQFACACGNKFENQGTLPGEVHVEICGACHPFFTGKEKLVDSAGRIEKFNRRYKKPGA